MKTEKLEQIRTLKKDSENLRTIEQRYHGRVANSNIDKYAFKFDSPDRSLQAFSFELALVSYTGAYGSSSVSAFSCVADNRAVRDAFFAWANKNKALILEGIACELDNKAAKLLSEAEAEVKELGLFLERVKAEIK